MDPMGVKSAARNLVRQKPANTYSYYGHVMSRNLLSNDPTIQVYKSGLPKSPVVVSVGAPNNST